MKHFEVCSCYGLLKRRKESIFTGTNNFVSDTITNSRLNEYFGFVQSEVDSLLKDADLTTQAESIKKWYDGYPEPLMFTARGCNELFAELQRNPKAKAYQLLKTPAIMPSSLIDYAGSTITQINSETLMAGGCIVHRVDENLTYDYPHPQKTILEYAVPDRYLTKARVKKIIRVSCLMAWLPL
ncbi:MAG: AAA family ATPase [Faecalibacterium sp.]